jgi:hypothetical protein
VVGPTAWWFARKHFDLPRAAGLALTAAVLVSGTLLAFASARPGPWRPRIVAAVPAVWCAAIGTWIGIAWWGRFTGVLLVVLAVLVVGGGGQLWVWWWQHGRVRTMRVAAASVALLLAVPFAGAWWLWHMSAHLGTAGEPTPTKAADALFAELAADPIHNRIGSDAGRLVCQDDQAGRRQTRAYLESWARFYRSLKPGYSVSTIWLGKPPRVTGDEATLRGTLMLTYLYPNNLTAQDHSDMTVRLVHEDGWRVCGFPGLHIPAADSSSPSPSPTGSPSGSPTRSASTSPSPTDGGLVGGAPSAMQRCGPDDPYRHTGWYTCPPG